MSSYWRLVSYWQEKCHFPFCSETHNYEYPSRKFRPTAELVITSEKLRFSATPRSRRHCYKQVLEILVKTKLTNTPKSYDFPADILQILQLFAYHMTSLTDITNCTDFQSHINCQMSWLHVEYNYFECFIAHVTRSETEIKLFQPLKFQNYFSNNEHVGQYS